jgi:hypothetical protein
MKTSLLIATLVLSLAACGGSPPPATDAPPGGPPATACTEEAKVCPDGSAVGRSGPNCEFAPCPGEGSSAPAPAPTP